MEIEKQKLLISCLTSSRDLMAMCCSIIKPSYFDATLKKSVTFIQDYFQKYNNVPKISMVRAECGTLLEDPGQINSSEIRFIADEVEVFCRNRAVTEAILAGPKLLHDGDFGKIVEQLKQAISVGLQKDLGLDYFCDPVSRLRNTLQVQTKISTGIKELDDAIGGGISRQELLLFAANSGGGKSMTMLNVAKNLLSQGLNGVYISLEMAEGIVSKRLDSMITRISQDLLIKEMNKAAEIILNKSSDMGKFLIKRMPENRTNVNSIRSYLQQVEQSSGFKPDFIVVDYIDIMGTTMSISHDNLFVKDKYVTEEVRSLGYDFNCIMISASQLGRNAIDAEKLNQSHIQGGISKINTSDYTVAVKQDDLMRASGEIYLEILKSRNSAGVGKRLLLGWDPVSLSIFSLERKNSELPLVKRTSNKVLSTSDTVFDKQGNDEILNLMNT